MEDYVRKQNAVEILVNAFKIYRDHFDVILLAFLPTLPFAILQDVALGYDAPGWIKRLAVGLNYFVSLLVVLLVVTVIVSEICRQIQPSLSRAFGRLRVLTLYQFAVTYLLAGLLFFVGFFLNIFDLAIAAVSPLLFVPLAALVGVSLYGALMFFPSVLVTQSLWGFDAIRRSASLGKGRRLRNAGIVIGIYLLNIFLYLLLIYYMKNFLLTTVVSNVVGFLIKPYVLICVVLLYYDMRTRHEPTGYDRYKLAAEMGPL